MRAIAGSRRAVEEEKLQRAQRRGRIQGEEVGLKRGVWWSAALPPGTQGVTRECCFPTSTAASLFWPF